MRSAATTAGLSRGEVFALRVYAAWAAFTLLVTAMRGGASADNATRAMVVAMLGLSLAARRWGAPTTPDARPALAYVLRCTRNALVVEFFYLFSRPVFASLRWSPGDPPAALLRAALVDFAFTAPAYLVIFSVMWRLVARVHYGVAEYAILFSLGQALGDGNAAFAANPALLLLAPWVMLNYQAVQVTPYLRARDAGLLPAPARGPWWRTARRWALPLVVIPSVYWVMGALIQVAGRRAGFVTGR